MTQTQFNLEESANLYAEIYEQDLELQELTESALLDLPELRNQNKEIAISIIVNMRSRFFV